MMDAPNPTTFLPTSVRSFAESFRRRRPQGWNGVDDDREDELALVDKAEARLLIEATSAELDEARQAHRYATERLALHDDGETEAPVWERRPYLLTSGLGTFLAGLVFATAPLAGASVAALAGVLPAGALALSADRLGRDFRLVWHAGRRAIAGRCLCFAGSAVIAAGLAAASASLLAGQTPIWILLLMATLLTLAIAGWRRQDPDPEREALRETVRLTAGEVDTLEAARRDELEAAKSRLERLLAELKSA